MNDENNVFYGEYEKILQDAMNDILYFAVNIRNTHGLVEHIRCRLKSKQSIEYKLLKLGVECNLENAKEYLNDLIGVRLICDFLSDIYVVSRLIQEKYEIITIKDYIENPKPNGYRSYHLIVKVPINNSEFIPAEIQLRTISQDSWASLEHKLKYKKDINNEKLIREELKRFSYDMAATDLCMQTIREFIEENI